MVARLKTLLSRIGDRLNLARILSGGRRKWWLTGSIAFIALTAIGLSLALLPDGSSTRPAGDTQPLRKPRPSPLKAFDIRSSYVHAESYGDKAFVFSGAVAGAPRWGAVLVEERIDTGKDSREPTVPVLYTASTQTGALEIVSVSKSSGDILFRSTGGFMYLLSWGDFGAKDGFYDLGPELDPEHLPKLAQRGLAVPATFGKKKMILLWSLGNPKSWFDNPPRLYGYIDGFRLPETRPLTALERPLIGPDGKPYRVDPEKRRLVQVSASEVDRSKIPASPYSGAAAVACVSWPEHDGVSYRSCPDTITRSDWGVRKTIFSDNPGKNQIGHNFAAVLPSPDGKTLLLERDVWSCGTAKSASFLPATGGKMTYIARSEGASGSLGWLDDNTALVAVAGGDCNSDENGSVYAIETGFADDLHEIAASNEPDATLWGRLP